MSDVLLLNADARPLSLSPLSVISWQMAVKAYFADKVTILKSHDDRFIRSQRLVMKMPLVVVTNRYLRPPSRVKFTRKHVFVRDEYECQYCYNEFNYKDLTFDHVVPRSLGGNTSWENVTTACHKCNLSKGNNPNIKPKKMPKEPTYWEIVKKMESKPPSNIHHSWYEFLPWDNLKEINAA